MTNWSKQQQDIFSWFREGSGNLVVRARAGTGKTSTIIEGVSHAPENRILLAAFNKSIATELETRLKHPGAEAKTLHSLGFGFVRQYWNKISIDSRGNRAFDIARKACKGAPDDILKDVVKLSAILKATTPMIGSDQEIDPSEIILAEDTASEFGISIDEEWEDEGYNETWLAQSAIEMLRVGCTHRDGMIDFDDMIWLPVRNGWARPRYDLVIIDESQDMNRSQIDLAQMACRRSGRIVVVGDEKQAIYSWRGADSRGMDRLLKSLNAKELGLTTTYRCAKAIVREAKRLVPDFRACKGAPEGKVAKANIGLALEMAEPGDFILSRTNAPLVSTCLKLLRAGKRANIEGRDVGAGLKSIVKKLNTGPARRSLDAFCQRLEVWLTNEVAKAQRKGERGLVALGRVYDQHETLFSLMDGLATADEIITRIDSLFTDTKENKGLKIILSSVHRSKGLEAERVWLLEDTFFSRSTAMPAWASQDEEKNIEYVAITRAKTLLMWVEGTL